MQQSEIRPLLDCAREESFHMEGRYFYKPASTWRGTFNQNFLIYPRRQSYREIAWWHVWVCIIHPHMHMYVSIFARTEASVHTRLQGTHVYANFLIHSRENIFRSKSNEYGDPSKELSALYRINFISI